MKVSEFIIDETVKAGNEYRWLCVAIEPRAKIILGIHISIERTMFVAKNFVLLSQIW
jgi:hypothetical protein